MGIHLGCTFNIDLNTHVEYRRPPSTLFGFSVAAHKEADVGWVIVGAPEDDSEQAKVGIEKAGAVYRCQTRMPFRCDQIPFDTSGKLCIFFCASSVLSKLCACATIYWLVRCCVL